MGTKNNPGAFDCYENADPDEPMFVLLARDDSAADIVRTWVHRRQLRRQEAGSIRVYDDYDEKAIEAMECARQMEAWNEHFGPPPLGTHAS